MLSLCNINIRTIYNHLYNFSYHYFPPSLTPSTPPFVKFPSFMAFPITFLHGTINNYYHNYYLAFCFASQILIVYLRISTSCKDYLSSFPSLSLSRWLHILLLLPLPDYCWHMRHSPSFQNYLHCMENGHAEDL